MTKRQFYRVWCEEFGGEEHHAALVAAYSPTTAAEDWASAKDRQGEYTIVSSGDDYTVYVRPDQGGDVMTFIVSAHAEPVYTAREKRGVR